MNNNVLVKISKKQFDKFLEKDIYKKSSFVDDFTFDLFYTCGNFSLIHDTKENLYYIFVKENKES